MQRVNIWLVVRRLFYRQDTVVAEEDAQRHDADAGQVSGVQVGRHHLHHQRSTSSEHTSLPWT